MKAYLVGCALALLGSACAAGGAADVAVSERDSAGIRIVDNPGDDSSLPH